MKLASPQKNGPDLDIKNVNTLNIGPTGLAQQWVNIWQGGPYMSTGFSTEPTPNLTSPCTSGASASTQWLSKQSAARYGKTLTEAINDTSIKLVSQTPVVPIAGLPSLGPSTGTLSSVQRTTGDFVVPEDLKTQAGQTSTTSTGTTTTSYGSPGSITLNYNAGAGGRFSGFSDYGAFAAKSSGTDIKYRARTSCDNSSWSNWVSIDPSNPNGSTFVEGKYFQLEATLSTTNNAVTPSIDKLSINHEATSACDNQSFANLATNSSVESDPAGVYTSSVFPEVSVSPTTFTWASDVAHTGSKSLKIVSTQPDASLSRWTYATGQGVVVGHKYKVSGWIKTSNVTAKGIITLRFFSGPGQSIQTINSAEIKGTSDWTQVSVEGVAPAGTTLIYSEFMLYGPGTYWGDDLFLADTTGPPTTNTTKSFDTAAELNTGIKSKVEVKSSTSAPLNNGYAILDLSGGLYPSSGTITFSHDAGVQTPWVIPPPLDTKPSAATNITYEVRVTNDKASWPAFAPLTWFGTTSAVVPDSGRYIEVRATLTSSNTAQSPTLEILTLNYNVPVDKDPPAVNITSPANNGTVSGNVTISANATDDIGVTGVQFKLDGQNLGAEDTSAPYSITWDASAVTGTHKLTALAKDASGKSNTSSEITLNVVPPPCTNKPSVPANLRATATAHNSATLAWNISTASCGSVSGYKLYRDGSLITTTNASTLDYTDNNLIPTNTYAYTVSSIDTAGNESDKTAPLTITTPLPPDTEAPTMPKDLRVNLSGATNVSLTWGASTDNIGVAAYKVYRATESDTCQDVSNPCIATLAKLVATLPGDVLKFSDADLTPNTTYFYYVSASDAANNEGPRANVSVVTVDTLAPTTPTDLIAIATSPTSVNLAWTASTDNVTVTGYEIYRGEGNATPALLATSSASTIFTDSTASADSAYNYYVLAVDGAGNKSAQSAPATVTTPKAPDIAAPVVSITNPAGNSTVAGNNVTISASATDNVAIREVQFYLDYQGDPSTNKLGPAFAATANNSYSFTWDTTTLSDGPHTLTAIAADTSNNTKTATTITVNVDNPDPPKPDATPPNTPTGLASTGVSESAATIFWLPSEDIIKDGEVTSGIASYNVYRNDQFLINTTTLAIVDANLTPGTDYSYQVASLDNAGNESARTSVINVKTAAKAEPQPEPQQPSQPSTNVARGDINGDKRVNVTDLSILLSNYGKRTVVGDFNGDNIVNVIDLSILLSNYGK